MANKSEGKVVPARSRKAKQPDVAPMVTRESKQVKASARATSPDERARLIAEAAYYRAESRGFAPGHEVGDWLDAEREVDTRLGAGAPS
jgi:Protein of unknown function (DUF2934)